MQFSHGGINLVHGAIRLHYQCMVVQLPFSGELLQGYISSSHYYSCLGVLVVPLSYPDVRRVYEAYLRETGIQRRHAYACRRLLSLSLHQLCPEQWRS